MSHSSRWQWVRGINFTPVRARVLAGACAGCIGFYLLYRNISSVRDKIAIGTSKVFELEGEQFPYIYLPPNLSGKGSIGSGSHQPDDNHKGVWFPWLQKYSHDPWTLLRLARSDDHSVRLIGVQALAQHHGWHDAEYQQLAQALDSRTMIALARSEGADPRLFLKPPRLPKQDDDSTEDAFRTLLAALPTSGIDECAQYFTANALQEVREGMADERGGLWCYGDSGLSYAQSLTTIPREKMEMYCIEALLEHSLIQSHCVDIVRLSGLQLLQRVRLAHPDSPNILQHVAQIIRNLAVHEVLHQHIVESGWVGILAEWMRSEDTGLASTAASTLGNLDRDFGLQKYKDQIYLCHPAYRSSDPVYADIVFIHGLLGGAFRTWRQKDIEVTSDQQNEMDQPREKYTFCWPKTWLAEDCPDVRILLVDYDTQLSEWTPKCPYESDKRTISARSMELLDKLVEAGLGDRPLVFVAHSMGGLLVKQMLVHAEQDPKYRKVLSKTRGVVLYSTPHRGTQLAAYSTQARYILNPSVEVKELSRDSPMLLELHERFKRIVYSRGLPTLCFGELEKTKLMNMKLHVVPTESSDPGFGEFHTMNLDHLDICKPSHRDSDLYRITREFIEDCLPMKSVGYILNASAGRNSIISDYMS